MPTSRVRLTAPTLVALSAVALGATACTSGGGHEGHGAPTAPAATAPQAPSSDLPSPDPTTPPPAGSVTRDQLPRAADLVGPQQGAWTEGETTSGSPTRPLASCQRSKLESTGASAIWSRRYTGPAGATAGAAVLSFRSPELAQQAAATLGEWWNTCDSVIMSNGGKEPRLSVGPTAVAVPGGTGTLTQVDWRADGASKTESQGVAVVGDRLVVVAIDAAGTWPAGADHPMARTLPKAAERLRS